MSIRLQVMVNELTEKMEKLEARLNALEKVAPANGGVQFGEELGKINMEIRMMKARMGKRAETPDG